VNQFGYGRKNRLYLLMMEVIPTQTEWVTNLVLILVLLIMAKLFWDET